MPEYLRIITETHPEMEDVEIYLTAHLIGTSCLSFFSALVAAFEKGTVWHPLVLLLGVIAPGTTMVFNWLLLIFLRRLVRLYPPARVQAAYLDFWLGPYMLGFCCFSFGFGLAAALWEGTVWDPIVLAFVFEIPGILMCARWMAHQISKRPRSTIEDGNHVPHPIVRDGSALDLE
jgi:hypothetical protein